MQRRVSWWDGYSRPWQLPERFLGGANEAAPSSPATAAVPERFRASCADEGVGAASPLVPARARFPVCGDRDPVVRAGDAGAQSQNLEAQPEPTGVDSEPGSAEVRSEGRGPHLCRLKVQDRWAGRRRSLHCGNAFESCSSMARSAPDRLGLGGSSTLPQASGLSPLATR